MTGFSRYIIVSSLPENVTEKDFLSLCSEFGSVRSCRLQKSEKGSMSGFCEYENCDSATMAVRNLNSRSANDGNQIRASFSKFRSPNGRTCHLRVKFLPKHITQEEVMAEFSRFGRLTRCRLVQYEKNTTAHLSFENVEIADYARHRMQNQCWMDNPDNPRMLIEFNSAYSNGRKSNSHHDEDMSESQASAFNHNNSMPLEESIPAVSYSTGNVNQVNPYFNFVQPQYVGNNASMGSLDVSQDYQNQGPKSGNMQTAQYVQFHPYCWPNNYAAQQPSNVPLNVYDQQQSNGINQPQNGLASSPPVKANNIPQESAGTNPQWAQFYSQLIQQMQNTHLYQTNPSQYQQNANSFGVQPNSNHPMILNPQSLYCATAISPTPHNYSLFLNANQGGYFRGMQPSLQQSGNFRYNSGTHYRPAIGGFPMVGNSLSKSQYMGNQRNGRNTLYVYNIGNSMTHESLRALFSPFGIISDVSVPLDPSTGASRNFGFVNYRDAASASLAIDHMNGFLLYDRVLQVSHKRLRVTPNTSGPRGFARDRKEGDTKQDTEEVPSGDLCADKEPDCGQADAEPESEHNPAPPAEHND